MIEQQRGVRAASNRACRDNPSFDFNELCKLASLGLWEHAELYSAGRYKNFCILPRDAGNYIFFTYDANPENDPKNFYPLISLNLGSIV